MSSNPKVWDHAGVPPGSAEEGELLLILIPIIIMVPRINQAQGFSETFAPGMSCEVAPPLWVGHFGYGNGVEWGRQMRSGFFFAARQRRRWHGFILSTSALHVPSFLPPPAVRCKHSSSNLQPQTLLEYGGGEAAPSLQRWPRLTHGHPSPRSGTRRGRGWDSGGTGIRGVQPHPPAVLCHF